jgi:hypothetical protein
MLQSLRSRRSKRTWRRGSRLEVRSTKCHGRFLNVACICAHTTSTLHGRRCKFEQCRNSVAECIKEGEKAVLKPHGRLQWGRMQGTTERAPVLGASLQRVWCAQCTTAPLRTLPMAQNGRDRLLTHRKGARRALWCRLSACRAGYRYAVGKACASLPPSTRGPCKPLAGHMKLRYRLHQLQTVQAACEGRGSDLRVLRAHTGDVVARCKVRDEPDSRTRVLTSVSLHRILTAPRCASCVQLMQSNCGGELLRVRCRARGEAFARWRWARHGATRRPPSLSRRWPLLVTALMDETTLAQLHRYVPLISRALFKLCMVGGDAESVK